LHRSFSAATVISDIEAAAEAAAVDEGSAATGATLGFGVLLHKRERKPPTVKAHVGRFEPRDFAKMGSQRYQW
jgi:hypothetical protein